MSQPSIVSKPAISKPKDVPPQPQNNSATIGFSVSTLSPLLNIGSLFQ
ncbi:MAG: hypothetical protein ACJAWV_002882 [Flammeovirgaceae bacterium]|jgi:hypothetical protein